MGDDKDNVIPVDFDEDYEQMFSPGHMIEKVGGSYGGPGKVLAAFQVDDGKWRYVAAHKIEGGTGFLLHIYERKQIRHLK